MRQPNRLRWALNILGVYLTILGVLFLFLPGVAEAACSISLPDPALTPLYGQGSARHCFDGIPCGPGC